MPTLQVWLWCTHGLGIPKHCDQQNQGSAYFKWGQTRRSSLITYQRCPIKDERN